MEQWREDAQPERPRTGTEDEAGLVEDDRPASGSFATDHGTWFSRGVPDRTAGANDGTVARTVSRAAGPDDRAGLKDRVAPDDTKATTTTMSATPPPDGTDKMPAPLATPEDPATPEETRALRSKPHTTATPPSTGSTGFTARLSTQSPGTPRPPRATLRDPWQEGDGTTVFAPAAATLSVPATGAAADMDVDADAGTTEHTHDPHEVTIQLDAVRFGDGVLRATPGKHRIGAGPDVADGPVFVDESGRRSRLYRRIGLAVGLACAAYAIVIVATLLSGNSNAPWLPVPGQDQEQPAGKVETSPRPAEPDASPGAGSGTGLTPGAEPAVGDADTLPSPGASLPAGGAPVAEGESGRTTGPSSTPTRTTPGPGTGVGGPTTTAPAVPPAASAPADPPAPSGSTDTGTDPTTPPAGEDPGAEEPAGADDLAHGPAEAPAVAAENPAAPPNPSTAPTAPSPEHVL
ncbi:hypothetical protein ACFYQA_30035 [Streptomyces sp. NPDC005774]|uniref:hypothetical protein n=1 Tax=Streptomyces sp. NPDC005774 TaxID=3364728 RepID=UPI0036CD30A5